MTATTHAREFESILGRVARPARLIGNEFGAGPGFSGDETKLRVVLGFPDTYEIGISNQALQILYHLVRGAPGVEVERTYLPWVDVITEMRGAGVPLLTTETWSPVAEIDLLALTLQHEFNYTNVLEMLDLAGVPLRAADREDSHPLVLAGGPATANFLPMAPFLDVVAVGDGEEVFVDILGALAQVKAKGASRAEAKALLSEIPGIFVPGLSTQVVKRTLRRLSGAPYPASCLVPLTAGVHDRSWIEVMRGCTRGCRFCQAGNWYRPVRERSAGEVLEMARAQLKASGHQELALASLSTTDYAAIQEVLEVLAAERPDVRISLPSLRVDTASVRLAHLASPTGPSLTLAPEAGSQRMRDVINKNVTEDEVLAAATEALRGGRTTLKLYFVIGFPTEEDDDVIAIADLCHRVRDLGRRMLGQNASRLQLNISINNFVPKPFTPFQWTPMAEREVLERRQALLKTRLPRRGRGMRLSLHDVERSFLEAALARGDSGLSTIIEGAWRRGARFDSWTEEFDKAAWDGAFEQSGIVAESLATREIPRDEVLPWDVIHGGVDKDFLWSEWQKAKEATTTADCRWEYCSDCGVCGGDLANELSPILLSSGAPGAQSTTETSNDVAVAADGHEAHRYLLTFTVSGRARFVGHLDKTELFRRAVRRAGARLAMSAGMRPKPLLTLALPLPVGTESEGELCQFTLAEEPPADFLSRLADALPPGLSVVSLDDYEDTRAVAARVAAAWYEVDVETAGPDVAPAQAADRFREERTLHVEDRRDDRIRRVDVKSYVESIHVETVSIGRYRLTFRVKMTPQGSVRVERVVGSLSDLGASPLTILASKRTRLELT